MRLPGFLPFHQDRKPTCKRNDTTGRWSKTDIALEPRSAGARSFASHRDKVTGILSLLKIRSGLKLLHLRDSVVSLQIHEKCDGFGFTPGIDVPRCPWTTNP